jgi:hypothetical protein
MRRDTPKRMKIFDCSWERRRLGGIAGGTAVFPGILFSKQIVGMVH